MRRLEARAPAPADLPAFLARLWRRWGLTRADVDALVVGARGVWTAAERRREARRLAGLARRVRVLPDAEVAFRGVLGNGPGVLVLAGTGSIVVGTDGRGRWARAGGLGPLLGDEGSAFWLGRSWLHATSRATPRQEARLRTLARAPDAPRRIAALAPRVLRLAARGDRSARALVLGAQDILAGQARAVARDLGLTGPVPLSWAGSLMDNPAFRRGVLSSLRRQGLRARPVPPSTPPVGAALALAERLGRERRP